MLLIIVSFYITYYIANRLDINLISKFRYSNDVIEVNEYLPSYPISYCISGQSSKTILVLSALDLNKDITPTKQIEVEINFEWLKDQYSNYPKNNYNML